MVEEFAKTKTTDIEKTIDNVYCCNNVPPLDLSSAASLTGLVIGA